MVKISELSDELLNKKIEQYKRKVIDCQDLPKSKNILTSLLSEYKDRSTLKVNKQQKPVRKIAIGNAKERVNALMIDGIVVFIVTYALIGFPSLVKLMKMGPLKITLYSFIVMLLYEVIFLKYKAATLGKMIFKIKVIQYQNPLNPLTLKKCFIRSFSKSFFSTIAGNLPYAFAFFNTERRQLADFLADTQVISTNSNKPTVLPKRPVLGIICLLLAIYSIMGTISNFTKKGKDSSTILKSLKLR